MVTLDKIQRQIAEAIKQSGMTQTTIANKLGIKPTQICSYIKGRKLPALDTFANLCIVLDVDPADILGTNEIKKTGNAATTSFRPFAKSRSDA